MASAEEGWWEVERARWIRQRVVALAAPGSVILDVGCGRGSMLGDGAIRGRVVINVDSHRWSNWRAQGSVHFVVASADALPFRDHAFDLVGSFDVLEHLADDQASLREQARVVHAGGQVVAAVPADLRLWSAHDVAVGHVRRYDRNSIVDSAAYSGLSISRSTAFFSFLWLPAYLTRRRSVRQSEPGNGTSITSRIARAAISLLAAAERGLLRRWRLPLGTSLWIEASPAPSNLAATVDGAGETSSLTSAARERQVARA